MAIGQAAGIVAAEALNFQDLPADLPADVPAEEVRRILCEDGACVE